jgi:hypothetical protein
MSNQRYYDDSSSFDNVPLFKRYKLTIEYKDGSIAEFSHLPYEEIEKIINGELEDEMEGYSIDVIEPVKKR